MIKKSRRFQESSWILCWGVLPLVRVGKIPTRDVEGAKGLKSGRGGAGRGGTVRTAGLGLTGGRWGGGIDVWETRGRRRWEPDETARPSSTRRALRAARWGRHRAGGGGWRLHHAPPPLPGRSSTSAADAPAARRRWSTRALDSSTHERSYSPTSTMGRSCSPCVVTSSPLRSS
ncbi:Hypothetical protein NTJ_05189 [Nesidiocoris tenuis]|uniref:Uncharacterized protein n=1 Tax=Nesidiocoris tenuis TaxID=355587 RepID=A0ABN7AJE6_9HEMI|nr:Hypothetical protein NTJ_05189 [Nesidiocoris tenuis]